MVPKVIGHYRILETLGSGGVGTVYRSIDNRTGEAAAVKLLSAGVAHPKAARRLVREFETLQNLSHANIVKVYDSGVYQGFPYLAMELIEGLTLRHYLSLTELELGGEGAKGVPPSLAKPHGPDGQLVSHSGVFTKFTLAQYGEEAPSEEQGSGRRKSLAPGLDITDEMEPLHRQLRDSDKGFFSSSDTVAPAGPPDEVELAELNRIQRIGRLKDAISQLCRALAYIHGYGLIHRDLKPSNVMVDGDRMVRLMDFGLAKYISDERVVTADGRLVGTFRYMAPEQILGERLDTRTDLYSLGVILYELLVGRPPFDAGTPYELWRKVLETEARPILELNPRCDRSLARVTNKLMRKEPSERFQTVEEVYEALLE